MFPKHYMKRYKQHETTKMTIPPKCPGCLHPLGSQGGGHPDPKIGVGGGGVFSVVQASVWSNNKGGLGGPWICH